MLNTAIALCAHDSSPYPNLIPTLAVSLTLAPTSTLALTQIVTSASP